MEVFPISVRVFRGTKARLSVTDMRSQGERRKVAGCLGGIVLGFPVDGASDTLIAPVLPSHFSLLHVCTWHRHRHPDRATIGAASSRQCALTSSVIERQHPCQAWLTDHLLSRPSQSVSCKLKCRLLVDSFPYMFLAFPCTL